MANISRQEAFMKAIADMDKNMKKQYSDEESVVRIFGDSPTKVETISTGSLVLDSILGGGFPKGRIIEIFGPEASGKTSVALTAAGNVQQAGGTVAFIDLENALDPRYAKKLGVNVKDMALSQPSSAEEALDLILMMAESGAVDLIVVDSIAAMVPKAELEGTMQDQTMAALARLLSRATSKLVKPAAKNGCTVIFINQLREKVGFVMGNPEITPGGKAMKFYASQRIRVARVGSIKEGSVDIGNEVKLKVIKNKVAPPFREGKTILTFGRGINVAAELAEVGPEIGAIEKPTKVSWVDATIADPETGKMYDPETKTGGYKFAKSKADAIRAMETDPELFDRISTKMYEILSQDDFDIEVEDNDLPGDDLTDEDAIDYDPETGEVIEKN